MASILRSAVLLSLVVALSGCFDASNASPEELVSRGREHRQKGEFEAAQGCLDLAIEKDAENTDAYRERAALWYAQKNLQYTLDNLDKLLEFAPEDAEGYRRKASVLSQMGKKKQAKDAIDRAIALDANVGSAYLERGKLLISSDRELAIQNLDKAIALDGELEEAVKLRAELSGEEVPVPAEHDVKSDAEATTAELLEQGLRLHGEGKFDEALGCFDAAIAADPELADAYLMRARIWLQKGDAMTALGNIDRAVVLAPESAEAFLVKGRVQVELGKNEFAKHAFDKAVSLNPELASAYYERGKLLISTNAAFAVNELDRACELDAKNPLFHLERSRALLAAGKTKSARDALDLVVEMDANLAEAFELRAQACEKLGDAEGAARDRARVTELSPGN